MDDEPRFLTLREVAEHLRLNVQTVYRLAQEGTIPAFKVGGRWRFDRARIDEWIAGQGKRSVGRPRLEAAPVRPEKAGAAAARPGESQQEPVLVVDDDEMVLEMITMALREAGYRVLGARDGPTALDVMTRTVPSLILLDVIMPGMDGLDVLRRVRDNPKTAHVPVAFLTGRAETEDRLRAIRQGGDDYILKPVRLDELCARVEMHLRRSRREREAERGLTR
jgi:excisionase family DNA binding protein